MQYRFAMVFVLLLAFALGANGLNADVIWIDELWSVIFMGVFDPPYSPAQIIDSIAEHSPDQVPLFYLLSAAWAQLAGWSQFSIGSISLFSAVLMLACLYRFTSDTVNRRTAIVSALLMSTNLFALFFFYELRGYTLLMLLAVVHVRYYYRLVSGAGRPKHWILFVLSAIALLYTHFLGFAALAGLGAAHFILLERDSVQSRAVLIGWGLGILAFSPYLPILLGGSFAYASISSALGAIELVAAFLLLLANGLYVLLLPLAPILVQAIRRKQHPIVLRMLLFCVFMGLTILFANQRYGMISLDRMRYFLLLWIPGMVCLAYGLTSLPRWRTVTALFLLLWVIAGYQFGRSMEIYDYTRARLAFRVYPALHRHVDKMKGKTWHEDFYIGFSKPRAARGITTLFWEDGVSIADYYLKAQLNIMDYVFIHTLDEQDVRGILREHPYVLLAHDLSDVSPNYAETLEIIQESHILCAVLVDEPNLLVSRFVSRAMDCRPAIAD